MISKTLSLIQRPQRHEVIAQIVGSIALTVKRQGWGESCRIRLWEREAYVLNGARTSPKGEVRESKHAVEPGANSPGPCGRPHGRQAADCKRAFSELNDMLGTRRLHMKPELVSALQCLKSWKRLGIQPTTTSALGLARTLSEEEISKI